MKHILIFTLLFVLYSCQFIGFKKDDILVESPIAAVFDAELYAEDIQNLLPKNISKEDSLVMAKNLIHNWGVKQIMLKKSLENNTSKVNTEINNLVENYRYSLLVNNYKEQLIKQQLDTLISEEEIDRYYELNQQNFKLNEELLKIKYLHLKKDLINQKEIIALFKSDDIDDLEALEKHHLNFNSFQLNDSTWVALDNILLKIPFSREILLKKTKFLQKQDSLS